MANNNANDTKVITGKVRLSYCNLFTPKAGKNPGDEAKYSVLLLIPKSDKVTLSKIKKAIEAAKVVGLAKLGGKIPLNLKITLHDGDTEIDTEEKPEYAGCYYMNASAKQKPAVVGTERDIEGKLIPITDETEVYSGCYGRVSLNFAAYNHPAGGKGISAFLNNVQKLADGESLGGGRSRADDDFGDDDDMLG